MKSRRAKNKQRAKRLHRKNLARLQRKRAEQKELERIAAAMTVAYAEPTGGRRPPGPVVQQPFFDTLFRGTECAVLPNMALFSKR